MENLIHNGSALKLKSEASPLSEFSTPTTSNFVSAGEAAHSGKAGHILLAEHGEIRHMDSTALKLKSEASPLSEFSTPTTSNFISAGEAAKAGHILLAEHGEIRHMDSTGDAVESTYL
ncbi:unnamed protein product [Gongylonema pulchrum]|uniref:DUF2345 domain-containing protein n=1 Tax=Gongylonema pulchrum TaxID=637853 RepID=A0A183EK48_9BILA|nr:unnamed protein product [Gongylonema pulchrum]